MRRVGYVAPPSFLSDHGGVFGRVGGKFSPSFVAIIEVWPEEKYEFPRRGVLMAIVSSLANPQLDVKKNLPAPTVTINITEPYFFTFYKSSLLFCCCGRTNGI